MELLREVNAESGSLDGQGGDGGGASATPLTSAAHASAQSPDHAPLPTPFDLNLTREQYITLIRKVGSISCHNNCYCHSTNARCSLLYSSSLVDLFSLWLVIATIEELLSMNTHQRMCPRLFISLIGCGIIFFAQVNDDYNILSDREVLSLPQLHRVELKQLLATTMDALELREEEAAMELAEDLRYRAVLLVCVWGGGVVVLVCYAWVRWLVCSLACYYRSIACVELCVSRNALFRAVCTSTSSNEPSLSLSLCRRFMHYSFWRWTSILMELEFANPVDNACTRNLRAFRFYSKLFMVVAATLYVNAALAHSPGLSKPHGPEDAGRAARGSLMPSLQPTVRPYV
jgi:hypothetical protein